MEGFSFQGSYEDRRGREAIVWQAEPSNRRGVPGYEFRTVIRGTRFWGYDFDGLEPADRDAARTAGFSRSQGGDLGDCILTGELPCSMSEAGRIVPGVVSFRLDLYPGQGADVDDPENLQLTATIAGERFEVTDDWFEDGVLRLDTALPPEVDGSRSSLGSRKAEPARLRQQSISICLSQEAWMGGILLLWDAAWVAVLEYLIKATSGEDLVLARGSVDQVLAPQSRPSQRVSGWGDYRIAVADGQVGFSWEAPGWQVMVEGMPEADAEGIVTEIAAQIGAATGQPTTWLAL